MRMAPLGWKGVLNEVSESLFSLLNKKIQISNKSSIKNNVSLQWALLSEKDSLLWKATISLIRCFADDTNWNDIRRFIQTVILNFICQKLDYTNFASRWENYRTPIWSIVIFYTHQPVSILPTWQIPNFAFVVSITRKRGRNNTLFFRESCLRKRAYVVLYSAHLRIRTSIS